MATITESQRIEVKTGIVHVSNAANELYNQYKTNVTFLLYALRLV